MSAEARLKQREQRPQDLVRPSQARVSITSNHSIRRLVRDSDDSNVNDNSGEYAKH